MPGIAVIGAKWGDEGKGKISHLLAEGADLVVRFNGGPNAGHTVVDSHGEIRLHHLPAGALREGTLGVLAHGMVIDPWLLREELQEVEKQGRPLPKLLISDRAHVILPHHKEMEVGSGIAKSIGTTRRGIGPSYADKALRLGLRFADLADQDIVRERLSRLEGVHRNPSRPPMDLERVAQELFEFYAVFKDYIGDSLATVNAALEEGRKVIFEGAQGTLLDIDLGTYPYVTSSHTTVHGIASGAGVPAAKLDRVIGVLKAYTTRVGEGPFPTEDVGRLGELLRQKGREYGATTGRPRRCGWLDLVALRYAQRVNGFTELAVTKLDVLSGIPEIFVCVAYRVGNEKVEEFPASFSELSQARPIYERLPGWEEEIRGARTEEELPKAAREYLRYIGEALGAPVRLASVGPRPEETVFLS